MLNIVTSYTKHGHDLEASGTFTQVREFLESFTISYVWGGDFNRPPEQLISETAQSCLGVVAFPPAGVFRTCSNGGLIDYFVSHVNEVDFVKDVKVVRGAPTTPPTIQWKDTSPLTSRLL